MPLKNIFDVHYADGRTAVVLEADLHRGWGRRKKTFGFFSQTRVPFRSDLTIRAQLSVIAQPASFDDWAKEFPNFDLNLQGSMLGYVIANRHLSMKATLTPEQMWRTTDQGRPEIFIFEQPLVTREDGRWYDAAGVASFSRVSKKTCS